VILAIWHLLLHSLDRPKAGVKLWDLQTVGRSLPGADPRH
jgi:hypothetical protein